MNIRVLLVDDHEVVRVGLRTLLDAEDGITVVGEAEDGPAAIRLAHTLDPDVVVLDIRMGAMDGIEACRAIKEVRPAAAILILTSFASDETVMGALVAGASGFLVKNTGRAEFVRAVRTLAAGNSLLDPSVTRRVTERLERQPCLAAPPSFPPAWTRPTCRRGAALPKCRPPSCHRP